MLSLLGAALPKNVVGAGRGNEAGHWEPAPLVTLHNRMLTEARSAWGDWRPFDPAAMAPGRRDHYKAEIKRLVEEEYGEAGVIVVKDPRICRFVWLYEEVLAELDAAPRFLLPFRNPLDVTASLAQRDGMTNAFAGLLWLRHVLDAEAATRTKPRALIGYDTLLEDWRAAAGHIGDSIDLEWPRALEEAAPEIDSHISRGWQHHAADLSQLVSDGETARWIKQTYAVLLDIERQGETAHAYATLDRIKMEFDTVAGIFGDAVFPEIEAREGRLIEARDHFAGEARKVRGEIERMAVEKDAEIRRLGDEDNAKALRIESLAQELATMQGELAVRESEIKSLGDREATLKQQIKSLNAKRANGERRIKAARRAREKAETELAALNAELKVMGGKLAALKAQNEAFRSSRAWRYGSAIWRIVSLPRTISLHAGRKIRLQPLHDVEPAETGGRITAWAITGRDPQFEVMLPRAAPLFPGHYRLILEIPPTSRETFVPQLYVDSGDGYNEAEVVRLRCRPKGRARLSATFSLNSGAQKLRLDPTDQPGTIEIGRLKLRKLGRLEYYGGLFARQVMRGRGQSGSLLRALARGLGIARRSGLKGLAAALRTAEATGGLGAPDYRTWIERHDALTADDLDRLRRKVEALAHKPLISVLMPVYNTPARLLQEAIDSVRAQVYENWELCIADDCSTRKHVRRILEENARSDQRIKVVWRKANGHIAHASNSAFELASGEWVAMMDHDDVLRPNALAEVALELNRHPQAEIVYSDEDKLDAKGNRYDPYFKPDFSRELFRSQNYLNHLTVHRAANIRAVGGWRPGFEGSQDYDLNLRVFERIKAENIRHIPKVLYHWRAVQGSTALTGSEKEYAYEAGRRALQEHVERMGLPAEVDAAPDTPFYRMRFSIKGRPPLVSLIIPVRDKAELLRNCITSIREKTTYPNYEIVVVDNGSVEPETLEYFEALKASKEARVIVYDKPFNFSAINNFAVKKAKGSIVGLINNDIEVISPDWLTEMVSWAVQPEVGCVGAKLYYSNDTVQHAGIILGVGGVAGHSHKYFPRDAQGSFSRLKLAQNLSAVTAACVIVRKRVYEEVGGMDEENLKIAFNDVDFCLKMRAAGYVHVWTPYAELYHHESLSRGTEDSPDKVKRFQSEVFHMQKKWALTPDPYYSVNLTLDREDFSLKASL